MMTTLRKWRFPILIGSGLIAAAALVYFSNGHFGADKTQGAIGKRDVYRDGQVASADVATPGSAPVATEAILESSELKALAKDPQFHQLLNDNEFKALSANAAFLAVLGNIHFREAAQRAEFGALISSHILENAVRDHVSLESALQSDSRFSALAHSEAMQKLFASDPFKAMVGNNLFSRLVTKGYFNAVLADRSFALLAAHPGFENSLRQGTMALAVARMRSE
jgi:hypothetical protein